MAITGKQRASRIDRRYTATVDRSIHWKRWFGVLGMLLGGLYGLWILFGAGAQKQVSTGDLSKAHFAWNESGCEECHVALAPIRETSFGRTDSVIALNNEKCSTCHRMSDHYAERTKPEVMKLQSCVQCHHEHLGFHHNLLDIADRSCVGCHADLGPYLKDGSQVVANVASFDTHPAFRRIEQREDPGTILFSHIQHMLPGQPKREGGADAMTWEGITEWSNRYALKRPEGAVGLIQLQCSDCHEPDAPMAAGEIADSLMVPATGSDDSSRVGANASTVSSKGAKRSSSSHRLYRGVQFEKHCEVCHKTPVPHGVNIPRALQAEEARIGRELAEGSRVNFGATEVTSQVVQEYLEKVQANSIGESFEGLVERDFERVRLGMFESFGCKKCHQLQGWEDGSSMEDRQRDPWYQEIVRPSHIPQQWLADASFTHGAHMDVQCQVCHKLASDAKQVMIEGVQSCRECHISDLKERELRGKSNGHVATADCIDCHRYHHSPPALPYVQANGLSDLGSGLKP